MTEQYEIDIETGEMISPDVKRLKEKMKNVGLTYDSSKDYETNKKAFDAHIERLAEEETRKTPKSKKTKP
ncbi:MAG: hypothetical protein ACOCQD_03310, partial [archaeon]